MIQRLIWIGKKMWNLYVDCHRCLKEKIKLAIVEFTDYAII
jgi:hypothetical protein